MKCKNCGQELMSNTRYCPKCGCPVNYQQPIQNRTANYQQQINQSPKKGLSTGAIVVIVIGAVFFALCLLCTGCVACVACAGGSSDRASSYYVDTEKPTEQTTNKITEKTTDASDDNRRATLEEKYAKESKEYTELSNEILYEYGEYLIGTNITTAVTIGEISNKDLKASYDGSDSIFFSFIMNFDEELELKYYKEDELVVITGKVKEKSTFDAIEFENCHILASGDKAKEKYNELNKNIENQKQVAEDYKKQYKEKEQISEAENKEDYKSKCIIVDYSDVERNPNNYDGKTIKVKGKVTQVIEGWFDSETILLEEGENTWYVTYTPGENESRILEDDEITVYGKCTGVSSYTSLLGKQITVPSMAVKYIE